ncbi:hypothetical protein P4C99_00670 [Pontiellaceae bacterium B1224]|nr:hypothetical protein [Pontiellaceae bacterium B1224]
MKNRSGMMGVAMATFILAGVSTQAQNEWTGDGNDQYNNAANWSMDSIPTDNATTNPYVVIANASVNGTINYADGDTNIVRSTEWYGGMTLNQTGGFYNSSRAGNTVRDWVGKNSTPLTTLNLWGGTYQSSHQLNIGIGGDALVNLDGGKLFVSRGGNGYFENGNGMSISMGSSNATLVVANASSLTTRGPIELGDYGTFSVQGAGSTISIGANGGTGTGSWYQNSNSVLRVGIGASGVSPIHIDNSNTNNTPAVVFKFGSQLDVGFIDGYSPASGSWPVMVASNAVWSNLGILPAAGVDTNDWGFSISGDILYVGYKLGWPWGSNIVPPPISQRTLYWTGAGGDTASDNPTNWVLNLAADDPATWGPYNNDIWRIADISVVGVELGTEYVVDYDGTAVFTGQRDLEVGIGAQGTYNHNSGDLTFTSHTSGRQEVGLNANGDGTINLNGGFLEFNAARFGVSGATGTLNINGGTFKVGRLYGDYSLWLGNGNGSSGTLNISGSGRLLTRGQVGLGIGGAVGTFSVEGSDIVDIKIGSEAGSVDGGWYQGSGSTLKARIDAGGITPIEVIDKGDTNSTFNGDVTFVAGSILDVDFMTGYAGGNGEWDIMTWQGAPLESDLAFADEVDSNTWSFSFVDTNDDTTNDTLRVKASGFGPEIQPDITAFSVSGATVDLSWDSEQGISYNVLSKSDLVNGSWSTNMAAIPGAGSTTSTNLTATGAVEFYQIEAYEE